MVGSFVCSRGCSPIPLAAGHRSANPARLRCGASPRGQLLRTAAQAPVAPQGGAKGSGYARGQLLRLAARAPVAPQGGAEGSGCARRAAASPSCPCPCCSARRGLWARAAHGGSCFAWLPWPLLLRKVGLKGSGCARRAAASPGCPCPCCSAKRGLRARAAPGGQLLRTAALAPVAPQGGAY
jgi:hypothetical protein